MQADIKVNIEKSISASSKVKIYFKLGGRSPLFGKFVRFEDHKELYNRGFIRLVPDSLIESFEDSGNINFTKLLHVNSFFDIRIYNND